MRKLFLTLLFGCLTIWATANVLTVNNTSSSGGQYTSLQVAIDAAVTGDTIYVHGSPNTYGDVTIKKRLILIGAGYAPQGTQFNYPSTVGYIYLDSVSTVFPINPISGTKLISLKLNSISSDYINEILVDRCIVTGNIDVSGKNWIIRNSLVGTIGISDNINCLITNNIINNINTSNKTSVIISNNILVTGSFSNISYAFLTNNIFWYSTPLTGFNYCTFSNNVTFAGIAQVLPYGTNTGSNNLNIDPQFISINIPTNNLTASNMPNYNWNVSVASACKNAGTDGTDIGIYGGGYPMANLTGAYKIPQITEMNIQNTVLPANGTLIVKFKARKQD